MMHLKTQCMTSTFDQMSALITANPSDIVTLSEAQGPNQLLLNHASIPRLLPRIAIEMCFKCDFH